MRRSYVDPGGIIDENPAGAAGPSGLVDKAQLAPTQTASGFRRPVRAKRIALPAGRWDFVPANDGILYMIITALLFASIRLCSFASAH
jgi:hypothetical protein